MYQRLTANWVYGGFLAAFVLLALAPLTIAGWPLTQQLTYLALPVYMIHQYEEHDADRFRTFVNSVIGGGREVLSRTEVFWLNIAGVWGVLVSVVWLATRVEPDLALIAAYGLAINGTAHIVQGIVLRRYNPGLVSSIVLFLPLSATLIVALREATVAEHLIGLALAIVFHAFILAHVLGRRGHA